MRVLIVDDYPGVLSSLELMFQSLGYEVVTAGSGREALALLEGTDVAVFDYEMPGMNGLELLRSARERRPDLPVILFSAHIPETVARAAFEAGVYDVLAKGGPADRILRAVRAAGEGRLLGAESTQPSA